MFDVAPIHGVDFALCPNKELFEYAKEAENDEATLRAIKSALTSRRKLETGFVQQWIDARLSMMARKSLPEPWYTSRAFRLVVVVIGVASVAIGQGSGQTLWNVIFHG